MNVSCSLVKQYFLAASSPGPGVLVTADSERFRFAAGCGAAAFDFLRFKWLLGPGDPEADRAFGFEDAVLCRRTCFGSTLGLVSCSDSVSESLGGACALR